MSCAEGLPDGVSSQRNFPGRTMVNLPSAFCTSSPLPSTTVCENSVRSVRSPSRYASSGVAGPAACAAQAITNRRKPDNRQARTYRNSITRRRGGEDLARTVGLQRPDDARVLHALEQARGAVVADLETTLDVGDRGLALGRDDL